MTQTGSVDFLNTLRRRASLAALESEGPRTPWVTRRVGSRAGGARLAATDLGLAAPARDRLIRACYRSLNLASFFTVGEDECRAWSILAGTEALEAAGEIHSDIQRGFIRAEVVPSDELLEVGSLSACRQRGILRLEGKTYAVLDGEVVHFRFNV